MNSPLPIRIGESESTSASGNPGDGNRKPEPLVVPSSVGPGFHRTGGDRDPPPALAVHGQPWWMALIRPRSCAVFLGVSALFLAYSAYEGVSMLDRSGKRLNTGVEEVANESPTATPSEVESMRTEADRVRKRLLDSRQDLNGVLAGVEASARSRGWNVHVSLGGTTPAPGGWDTLVGYPIVLELTPSHPRHPPTLARLADGLEEMVRQDKHAEVTRVVIDRQSRQSTKIRVELLCLGHATNDQTAPN